MRPKRSMERLGFRAAALLLAGIGLVPLAAAGDAERYVSVPERVEPPGIQIAPRAEREALSAEPRAAEALDALRVDVVSTWSALREVDLVELSRWDVDETRVYELPELAGELRGRVLARERDGSTETWFVELLGPRLPARFQVVERSLAVYGAVRFQLGSAPEVTRRVVTIRREVRE